MEINLVAIDLAKRFFQVHCVDQTGMPTFCRQFTREKLKEFIRTLKPTRIVMEACASAHYWGRLFQSQGHSVQLIAPQFVKPFVKSNKNDRADAEAIAEAAMRPTMRFVAVKSLQSQDLQSLHRIRHRLVRSFVSLVNETHGLLGEYGIVLPKHKKMFREKLAQLLCDDCELLSTSLKEEIRELLEELTATEERIGRLNRKLLRYVRDNSTAQRLIKIPGIGPLTATAVLASVSDPSIFKNGRDFSAWVGLVPRQHSSGGKDKLLGISKRGDPYLRMLFVHGARAVVRFAAKKEDRLSDWIRKKEESRGKNKTIVAVANKNARIVWSLMHNGHEYKAS